MPVGPQPEQYMHTTVGGQPDAPPLVLCPGYGAGTGFFFRCGATRLVSCRLDTACTQQRC